MLSHIVVQALRFVTAVENWIPLPTPPFGESTLSSGLVELEFGVIHRSAVRTLDGYTNFLETWAAMLHKQAAQFNQQQSETTEFLDLIESHRPLTDCEISIRDAVTELARSAEDFDAMAKGFEQILANIKSGLYTEEKTDTVDFTDVNNGSGLFVL